MHYDAEVMLAVLALEAHRAGATVVGEDLGTVEPEVSEALADDGMLGCAVSWSCICAVRGWMEIIRCRSRWTGQAMNITVTNNAGNLDFGLVGCRRSVPHLQRVLGHLETSLNELERAVSA